MSQLDIQPFTKRGMKLIARNPTRWILRHWSNNQDLGVAIRFELQTGKRNDGGTCVVLIPLLYAQERHFQLDFDIETEGYVLRTKRNNAFSCESRLFSTFATGGRAFVEQFWNHETVSDSDRYAMREAYLLFRKQEAATESDYMALKVAALISSIRQRLDVGMKYKVLVDARLLKPHQFYVVDSKNKERAHLTETLGAAQRVKIMDPSLFSKPFETTDGTKLFVPCITTGLAGNVLSKEGLLLLTALSYAFV